jgi:beta-lactamase class A
VGGNAPTVIAYCARDLATGKTLAANEDVVMPSWSTIKLLLAAAFWRTVERGELRDSYPFAFQPWASVGGAGVLHGFRYATRLTLADCVHLSLSVSDNDATNIVASVVKLERVNALAEELGLTATRMRRRMMDVKAREAGVDNTTSAADMVALLQELAMGPRLGATVRDPILASLAKTEHFDGIARYLPRDAVYMGKLGDDQPEGRFAHDCCLVGQGHRLAALAILTDCGEGYEAVSRLGAALFAAVGGGGASDGSGAFATVVMPSD